MIQIALLLLGREELQRRAWTMKAIAAVWFIGGLSTFIDALDGLLWFPEWAFGYFLVVEGGLSVVAALGNTGAARRLRLMKAACFMVVAILTLSEHPHSRLVLAMLFGATFLVDGVVRIACAWVVRFPGWRLSLGGGIVEVGLAIFMIEPYPTWYDGTVGYAVGTALMLSGVAIWRLAWRVRRLPDTTPLAALLWRRAEPSVALRPEPGMGAGAQALIVHVWTPTGLVTTPINHAIRRYIAAVDRAGVISTGHAAIELVPGTYLSHYPAAEIDRSPGQFARTLRAVDENDVPGRFQPSYAEEAAGWCESTAKVRFRSYDAARFAAFWAEYRKDNTYNLTKRNCSSAVALALDAAVEGAFAQKKYPWQRFVRALLSPELWAASLVRKRADTMAWTPGLVLDYARALNAVLDPPPGPWLTLARYRLWLNWRLTPHAPS
jgi:uncharacterized membrane protein HdeD (DUF308 family)